MKPMNKVLGTVVLQCANALLVFLNQVIIIRAYGLPAYGTYQHAYVLLMASPTVLTLGVFNLIFDARFGRRAIAPSLLLATVLAPLGLFCVAPSVVVASVFFTVSFALSYFALVDGRYALRALLVGGLLNVTVFAVAVFHAAPTSTWLLLIGAAVSAVVAIATFWAGSGNPLDLFKGISRTFKEIRVGHYGMFATAGVLSNLTYIVPISVTKYILPSREFGVVAFGFALARTPLIFSAAFGGIMAKPVATKDIAEVCRLSKVLSTLGLCSTALLLLNIQLILPLAHIEPSAGLVRYALFLFVGVTLWGDVDDIVWFSGYFSAAVVCQGINVGLTIIFSLLYYVLDFDVRIYLVLVSSSALIAYFARFRFLRSKAFPLKIDLVAMAILGCALPIAFLGRWLLSIAASALIAAYTLHRVFAPESTREVQ